MDESRDVLALLGEILSEEGFSLTLSRQLLNLEQIRACSPSLILMERRFGGLLAPSWDVVRRTRQDRELAQVPIVLSTTHRSSPVSAMMEKELRGRGVHVLLKPYPIDDLLGTIHACLTNVAENGAEVTHRRPDGQMQNAPLNRDTASTLDSQVRALLFPDGRVVVFDDPLRQLAKWRLLGRIRQGGELLSFVRIDAAGDSWTALVPSISLEQETMPLSVPLYRQSDSRKEPLSGWPLFS
jgi:CheY-like chemotaxis protein